MKRVLALFALAPALLLAGVVTYTLNTSADEVRFSFHNGFDVVELGSGILVPEPGKPSLPEVPLTLVIPAGARVVNVSVVPIATIELGRFKLMPAQPAHPLSKPAPAWVPPEPSVYSSDAAFPRSPLLGFDAGTAAGFRLVSVRVSPLTYRPLSGLLSLCTKLRVKVDFVDGVDRIVTLTPAQRDRAIAGLGKLVRNQEDLERFSPLAAEKDLPEIAYLIVTNAFLAPELLPLAEYRTSRGLRAEIRTVEWIERNYEGRDLQEKTRNLIRDYFEHRGLSYVLLAGDNPQVPSRRIRLSVADETGDIPTDLYYGDLDYSWDSNRNNLFGEMSDSVDLYADVIVGRASVDRASQVRNFIHKVKTYEQNPATDYIKRSLLPSGWLWRSLNYHGKFVNDSIARQTPEGWTDVKLENPSGSKVVQDSFDHGFALFDPAGHGNSSGVYDEDGTPIYLSSNATVQKNRRRYTIMTSLACTPGDFETEDCCAEYALNCDSAGCIGVMMNSRYGWGTPPQMGPSEKICVRFYDHLFNSQQYIIGVCHDRSREVYAGTARQNSLWRWCMTEFNLLGDPAIDIWTEPPATLAVATADTIATGAQRLDVTVRREGAPVSDAVVCAWKGSELFATARTNAVGVASLTIHPATPGELLVTVTGHNYLPGLKTVTVRTGAPEPYLTFWRYLIDDTGQRNPNGILEPGENCVLSLGLANIGSGCATSARIILRRLAGKVTVTDSLAEVENIPAGDTVVVAGLGLEAMPDAAPGSTAQFLARVTSSEAEWDLEFGLELGYPGRLCADLDTGQVTLTVTARGSVGFDRAAGNKGRGFRFPKTDTSCLNVASLCLAASPDYVVDRFYNRSDGLDADWTLAESVFARAPIWSADEYLTSGFSDAGHSRARNVTVRQHALAAAGLGEDEWVTLVYDLANDGAESLNGYVGVLADFDVVATDRLHDLAYTNPELATAYMRNGLSRTRWCGVKLLTAGAGKHLACIDHARYVYPDSGLSEEMKYRILSGQLGVPQADRTFNWSVAVSTGPLELAPGGTQRLAFAFVAADDSAGYLDACRRSQQWYDTHVGLAEATQLQPHPSPLKLRVHPNPATNVFQITLPPPLTRPLDHSTTRPLSLAIYDSQGRLVSSHVVRRSPFALRTSTLPAGVYHLRLTSAGQTCSQRVTIVR